MKKAKILLGMFVCVSMFVDAQTRNYVCSDGIIYQYDESKDIQVVKAASVSDFDVDFTFVKQTNNTYKIEVELSGDRVESGGIYNINVKPTHYDSERSRTLSIFDGKNEIVETDDSSEKINSVTVNALGVTYSKGNGNAPQFKTLAAESNYSYFVNLTSKFFNPYNLYTGKELIDDYEITSDINGNPIANNFVYYFNEDDESVYLIRLVTFTAESSYVVKKNCEYRYNISTIPTNFLKGNRSVTTLNIPGCIKTIEPNAFDGAAVQTFNFSTSNPYFVCVDGKYIYNYNKSTLVVVANQNDQGFEYTVPASVKNIQEGAMGMVENVTITSTNPDIKYSSSDFNSTNNNKVVKPSDNIEYKVGYISPTLDYIKSKGVTGISITPKSSTTLSKSMVQKLIANIKGNSELNQGVSYIDLTSCVAPVGAASDFGEISLSGLNKNCLLFLPAGIEATGTNVIVGDECEKLDITRNSSCPFESPYDFNASSVVINGLTVGEKYVGFIFPFDFEATSTVTLEGTTGRSQNALQNLLKCAIFDNYDTAVPAFNFNIVPTVKANQPFLLRASVKGQSWNVISFEDVKIKKTKDVSFETESSNNYWMSGTYIPITNRVPLVQNSSDSNSELNENYVASYTIFGVSDGVIKKCDGNTFKPFSSYIVKNSSSNISNIRIRVFDEDGIEEDVDQEVTDVQNVESTSISVSGKSILVSTEKPVNVNVCSVSGTVVFNEIVSGTKTIEVESGVYIVNGKKVIIK